MSNTLNELEKLIHKTNGNLSNTDAVIPCCHEELDLVSVLNRSEILIDRLIGLADDPNFDFSKLHINKETLIELRDEIKANRQLLVYQYHFVPADWVTMPKNENK